MFTAMVRRPIVWLLATLALLGAGWAAYGPLRQAWQPATETAGGGPQPGPATVAEAPAGPPPAPASAPAESVDAKASVPSPAAATAETPAVAPAAPAPGRQLAEPPAVPPPAASPTAPARTASPPEPGLTPPAPGSADQAPARDEAAAEPAPRSAEVPKSGPGQTRAVEPRVGELAPAAGPPGAPPVPAASAAPLELPAEGPVVAAAPDAAAPRLPESGAPPAIGPSGEPPASAAAVPEASPAPRQPPVASIERPTAAPEVAATTPLPSTEPAVPATSPQVAEPPASRSLSFDTIRRALAALLGGTPEPTDPVAPKVVTPAREQQPDQAQDAAKVGGAPEVVRPSFDIVRVEPGGRAVVAGRAAPGAEVELLAGKRVLDRVRADARGEWVAIPAEALPSGGLELGLRAVSEGTPALEAEQVVVVVMPEPPPPQPAPVAVAEGPPPQPPEVRQAEASSGPLAVLLAEDGRAPGRILQAPGRISNDGSLALLMLDYDDSGRTRLTGEAPPGAPLRIYVDNQPAAEAVAEPSGRWTAVLEHNLPPGEYTLRLDQLGSGGRPVARLETPFTRASQPPIQGKTQVDYVIVQPGNSLWRIARRLFGSGTEYVQIYDANKMQIRDPDLIYPGQVFEVPAGMSSSG